MSFERITAIDRSARTAMATVFVVVAAIAAYGWTVSPHLAYLQAVQRYEPVVKNVADRKRGVAKALGANRRQLQRLQEQLAVLRVRCFTPEEATQFFGGLERVAQEARCTVTSIDFAFDRRSPKQGTALDWPIVVAHRANLALLGGYDELVELLDALQDRPQTVCIESCLLELSDTRSGRPTCHLTITIWVALGGEGATDE